MCIRDSILRIGIDASLELVDIDRCRLCGGRSASRSGGSRKCRNDW